MKTMRYTVKIVEEPCVIKGVKLVWMGAVPHLDQFDKDFICLKDYDGNYCVFMDGNTANALDIRIGAEVIFGIVEEDNE